MATTSSSQDIGTRLVRTTFVAATHRDAAGVPRVPADFVAEQGQLVRILDVRDEAALCGPLGHIPAVTHVSLDKLGEVSRVLAHDTCVVVVSTRGGRAGIAARMLEEFGMKHVAAMEGGMAAWKQLGFTTLRTQGSYRTTLRVLQPGIGRDGTPLVEVTPGTHLTAEQIANHVGEATSVRWVKLGAFLLHGKRSCVDGRDSHGVIGTPGGDAGELLLALAAVEKLDKKQFSREDVECVLIDHVDTFGRFYMHTDVGAMTKLVEEKYRKDPRIAPAITNITRANDWLAFHAAPPEELRDAVLEHLATPEVMGCGHLRFAMTVGDYQVRPGLAQALLESFHRLRWSGMPELEWIVLGGAHTEGAVVNITVAGTLHSYTQVPLVSPNVGGVQMFVNHPQVTSFLRRELAAALVERGITTNEDALCAEIEALGGAQAGQTLGRLAGGLPIFEIRFDGDGNHTVAARGAVPRFA
jgi:rhodanese-related sulfurtransferase